MYVYIQSEKPGWSPSPRQPHSVYLTNSLWTVGFYKPNGEWVAESDYGDTDAAADRVAYLNGAHSCQNCGLKRSVDEALNSGSGVYKP